MRKPYFYLLLALLPFLRAGAQPYAGYQTGNYTGVNGVFFNPANIVDSRFVWDINIGAFDAFGGYNRPGMKFGEIIHGLKGDSLKSLLLRGNPKMSAIAYGDILGPSFMLNLGPNTAFAFSTRTRLFSNTKDINGDLINSIIQASDPGFSQSIGFNSNQSVIHATGWTEFGVSLAQVFTKKGSPHFFKGGITLKYLAGAADASMNMTDISGTLANMNGSAYLAGPVTGSLAFRATPEANFSGYSVSDIFKFNGSGFGGDIGFVYEWRPKMNYSMYENDRFANKYKLKIGISLLDFGRISFNKASNTTGSYAVDIPAGSQYDLRKLQGKAISEYKAVLDASPAFFIPRQSPAASYSVNLPSTVQVGADMLFAKNFGLNAGARIHSSSEKNFNLYEFNTYWLTPRWENSRYGVELPLSYHDMTGFNVGIGFHAGPVFWGSGSFLSSLVTKTKQADFYVGIHIGITYKKKIILDTDDDGVFDNVDKCPNVAGSPRYQGCPIPDTDGDGVSDEEDSCIAVPGLPKYHGCPIPDTDGDGINDEEDSCVSVPGLPQYHGCPLPDRDGDGVPDAQDKCPLVPGFARFQGCPVSDRDGDGIADDQDLCPDEAGPALTQGCPVDNAVTRQITADFKNIQFDFGRARVRPESRAIILRAARIMNQDIPNTRFYVDGYTDNVGSAAQNKTISLARAQSVADILIGAGVNSSRIIVRGFGKDNPKCDNTTDEGRACNRRVEVIVRR